jgi:hypothetical protein
LASDTSDLSVSSLLDFADAAYVPNGEGGRKAHVLEQNPAFSGWR